MATSLQERRSLSLVTRESKFFEFLGGNPEDIIPASLWITIVGDFLDRRRLRPIKSFAEVRKSVNAYRRYLEICPEEQERCSAVLFDIFMRNESEYLANREHLIQYGELRDRVFEQEWLRIMGFLTPWEVKNIRKASPVFAMARHTRFRVMKNAMEEAYFAGLNDNKIWSDYRLRYKIYSTFGKRFNVMKDAQFFRRLFQENAQVKIRRDLLRRELGRFNLELRSDSRFCNQFIEGETLATLEEVVATMRVTSFLFRRGGHRLWSINRFRLETHMRDLVGNGNHHWYSACEEAMRLPLEWSDDEGDTDSELYDSDY